MSLVIDGERIETPGHDTLSWLDDNTLPHMGARPHDDGFPRTPDKADAITAHTSKGENGPLIETPAPPSTRAEVLARYQGRTPRDVSWHFTVDVDETIVQSADPGAWACWHAGQVNGHTIGIELVQYDDLALYRGQIKAAVWLITFLCDHYGIPKTVPVDVGCSPWAKIIPELMKAPEGNSGASWRGVYGHRNCSRRRGTGDPGDHLMRALLAAGFETVTVDRAGHRIGAGAPVCGAAPVRAPAPTPARISWPPIPSWVDADEEFTDTADRTNTSPESFVREHLPRLLALGVSRDRACEVLAHCGTESSWGRRGVAFNFGGVKLSKTDTTREERRNGNGLAWWRWKGHVEAGDDDVVYYRAFASPEEFWRFWLARYTPKTAALAERDRYIETGRRFWDAGWPRGAWFVAMLLAGYRGEVRQKELSALADPSTHPSVVEFMRVVERVRTIAQ